MSQPSMTTSLKIAGDVPPEIARLHERIRSLPARLRDELEPLADDAIEGAIFRDRVLSIARDGLERYRFDLTVAQFDLEATRREREALRRKLETLGR